MTGTPTAKIRPSMLSPPQNFSDCIQNQEKQKGSQCRSDKQIPCGDLIHDPQHMPAVNSDFHVIQSAALLPKKIAVSAFTPTASLFYPSRVNFPIEI